MSEWNLERVKKLYKLNQYFDSAANYPIVELPLDFEKDNFYHFVAKTLPEAIYAEECKFPGNSSSTHNWGQFQHLKITQANTIVKKCFNINSIIADIYWTASSTQAINAFIKGFCLGKKGTIIIGDSEHPSVENSANWLNKYFNIKVVTTSESNFEKTVQENKEDLLLVSHMLVNNETGQIYDVKKMVNILRQYSEAPFHADTTAAVAHINIDFEDLGVDAITFSGHKFGAPIGTGALISKRKWTLQPIISGGGQQRRVFSGTINAESILHTSLTLEYQITKIEQLGKRFREFKEMFKDFEVVCKDKDTAPNIISVIVDKDVERLQYILDDKGFAVSIGSACSQGTLGPVKSLLVLGYSEEKASKAIRISFWEGNEKEDIEKLINLLK